MRILHVSDLHARVSQLRWVIEESKEFDLVCITGDLLDLNAHRGFDNRWVDGDQFEFGGVKFRCIPWLAPLDEARGDEVWLIHSPPDVLPTGITRGGMGFGDFSFGELCRNHAGPRLALSGHIHDPQSWRAKIGRT